MSKGLFKKILYALKEGKNYLKITLNTSSSPRKDRLTGRVSFTIDLGINIGTCIFLRVRFKVANSSEIFRRF